MKRCKTCGARLNENQHTCPICGMRDKDTFKPTNTLSKKNQLDEFIRCPNCDSTQIQFYTKDEGSNYDAENACCGYLLFGPIGLLCGLLNDKKTTTVRKCVKCGYEF